MQRPSEKLLDEVQRELQKAEPGLAFEIGYEGPKAPRVLVISADGRRERFAKVQRLVAAAPKLSGWRVVAFRQRQPGFDVEYQGVRLQPRDVWFSSERIGGAVNVVVFVHQAGSHPAPAALQGAVLLLLDATLGEYDVETRVEGIDIRPLPSDPPGKGLRPVSELPGVVDGVKALGPER